MLRIFWCCRFGFAGCSLIFIFCTRRFCWQCGGRHGVGIASTAKSYFVLKKLFLQDMQAASAIFCSLFFFFSSFFTLHGRRLRESWRRRGGGLRILSCSRVFFSFLFVCVQINKEKTSKRERRACTPTWKVCVRMVCVCVRVCVAISWLVASPVLKWRQLDVEKL